MTIEQFVDWTNATFPDAGMNKRMIVHLINIRIIPGAVREKHPDFRRGRIGYYDESHKKFMEAYMILKASGLNTSYISVMFAGVKPTKVMSLPIIREIIKIQEKIKNTIDNPKS